MLQQSSGSPRTIKHARVGSARRPRALLPRDLQASASSPARRARGPAGELCRGWEIKGPGLPPCRPRRAGPGREISPCAYDTSMLALVVDFIGGSISIILKLDHPNVIHLQLELEFAEDSPACCMHNGHCCHRCVWVVQPMQRGTTERDH